MQKFKNVILPIAFVSLAIFALTASSCQTPTDGAGSKDVAATVNGKSIMMEEIERVIKQQGKGQEAKLSPLELAQGRLQVLDQMIQQEVLFQRAEKEKTVPSDDEVKSEINKRKTASGVSQEEFDKKLKEAGETDESFSASVKKDVAIQKLVEGVTSKVEPPKDSEIDAFYNGNKEAFVKKKGVKLAAIVVDPADNGEGDTTKNEADAVVKGNEIIKQLATGADFAAVAREKSEDLQSKAQGGDMGYVSEDDLRKGFPPQAAETLMNPRFSVGQLLPTRMDGKFYIFKLQERSDKDEALTLESPGIRGQITDSLVKARKDLMSQLYLATALNDAKIENLLAKKILASPNDLSGARPASAADANTNSNANAGNANASSTKANTNTNTENVKKEEPKKPVANTNAPTANVAKPEAANASANANK